MARLHNWIEKIPEESKKGLRIIQKILDVDGKKRFKLEGTVQQIRELSISEVNSIPFEEAQK